MSFSLIYFPSRWARYKIGERKDAVLIVGGETTTITSSVLLESIHQPQRVQND